MDEQIKYIILLIGIIALVLCYIKLLINGRLSKQRFIDKAEAKGHYTVARLIDTECIEQTGNEHYMESKIKCTYEYRVSGISYKKEIVYWLFGFHTASKCPRTIIVYYKPRNPAKSVCGKEVALGNQWSTGWFWTIIFGAIISRMMYELLSGPIAFVNSLAIDLQIPIDIIFGIAITWLSVSICTYIVENL